MAEQLSWLDDLFVAKDPSDEVIIVSGQFDVAVVAFQRLGACVFDLARFPAAVGARRREIRFRAVVENALHSADYYAEVRLLDLTHSTAGADVVIASSTLSNASQADRGKSVELVSDLLPVSNANGSVRDDAPAIYGVELRLVGSPNLPNDRVILSSARFEVLYV